MNLDSTFSKEIDFSLTESALYNLSTIYMQKVSPSVTMKYHFNVAIIPDRMKCNLTTVQISIKHKFKKRKQ